MSRVSSTSNTIRNSLNFESTDSRVQKNKRKKGNARERRENDDASRRCLSSTSPFLTKRYSSLGRCIVGVIAETSDGGAAAFTCVHNAYRVTSSRIRTVTTCTRVTISRIKGNLVAPLSLSLSPSRTLAHGDVWHFNRSCEGEMDCRRRNALSSRPGYRNDRVIK